MQSQAIPCFNQLHKGYSHSFQPRNPQKHTILAQLIPYFCFIKDNTPFNNSTDPSKDNLLTFPKGSEFPKSVTSFASLPRSSARLSGERWFDPYQNIIMQKKVEKSVKGQVSIKDFEYLAVLGEGSFGKVRLVKKKNSNKYFCVKIMKKDELIKSQQVDHIANEYRILSTISHPFIVNFEGLAQNSRNLYIFMEYVPGGELFTHLREEGMFEPHKAAFYAAHIVTIFEYLHSKNIVYRDLKPENILIGVDGYLKLADFGFAKVIEGRTFTLCGTPEYLAPQILQNQGHGKSVDWWTLGVLIYEMIAGIDPFADDDPLVIYQNILKGKLHFPKGFDTDAKSLVRHLLVSDLSKRYGNLKNGVSDIKNHRYLNSINFNSLLAKKISPPFRPIVKNAFDTSNFSNYSDANIEGPEVKPSEDPFLKWD